MTPGTRLIYAMADQRQLPRPLARVYERFSTPLVAILFTAAAILALAVSGSFIYLVKITLIARITVYAMTCVTLPIFRRRASSPAPHFRLPGGPVLAIVGALLCLLFLANSSMRELLDVTIALIIGFAGFAYAKLTKSG
jgi:basic amino acid/polyamine antiporter, APA family